MKCFLILRFTPGHTKAIFQVVDGFFYIHAYFVGGIPFFCATDSSGISTKVLFRINVDHSPAGRRSTWMFTMAYAFGLLCGAVPFPFHFGAYEFHGWKAAAQMRFASLTLHGEGSVLRTAGNPVIINRVIDPFHFQFVFQRDICLFKGGFLKQVFIYLNGIECRIAQKGSRIDKRMFSEEICQSRDQGFGIRKAFILVWRI